MNNSNIKLLKKSGCGGSKSADMLTKLTGVSPDTILERLKTLPHAESSNEFLFTSYKVHPIASMADFEHVILRGVLYRYDSKRPGAEPVLVGRCPVCGTMNMWTGCHVGDDLTVLAVKNGQRSDDPAVMACNCARCPGKWSVMKGTIVSAKESDSNVHVY